MKKFLSYSSTTENNSKEFLISITETDGHFRFKFNAVSSIAEFTEGNAIRKANMSKEEKYFLLLLRLTEEDN